MENPPENWFCCLYPSEQSMLQVTAEGFLLTLYAGMPLDIWLAAWFVTGRGTEPYRTAFLHLYHAKIGSIADGDLTIDAVVPEDGFEAWWVEMVVWILSPGAACLEGCPQSQRPA